MIPRPHLVINRVEVRRLPGIRTPFAISNLSQGISIIFGPNGSGKSVTARAIHSVLWPAIVTSERGSVTGEFNLGEGSWIVDIDAGLSSYHRDGALSPPPELAPIEVRDRYILTLHDLLSTDNPAFAEHILRESSGGYDLEEAVAHLKFGIQTPRRGPKQQALLNIRQKIQDVERDAHNLAHAASQIATLAERQDQARASAARAKLLEKALDYTRAADMHDAAARLVASYPLAYARLVGDEVTALDAIDSALTDLRARKLAVELEALQESKARNATRLENLPCSEILISDLRRQSQMLQKLEGEVFALSHEADGLLGERNAARLHIGDQVPESDLPGLIPVALSTFARLVERRASLLVRQQAAEAVEVWFGKAEAPTDLERLRSAILLLQHRLRFLSNNENPMSTERHRTYLLLAAILNIIEGVLLATFVHPALAILILIGLVLLILSWRTPKETDETARLERDYMALGLQSPVSWSTDNINVLLNHLGGLLRFGEIEIEKAAQRIALIPNHDKLESDWQAWNTDRKLAEKQFGTSPDLDAVGLSLLANNIDRWQMSDARLQGVKTQRDSAAHVYSQLLDEINQKVGRYSYSQAANCGEVQRNIDDLDQRRQRFIVADQAMNKARDALDNAILPEIARRELERESLYQRADVTVGDDAALVERLARLDTFREAKQTKIERAAILAEAQMALADYPELLSMNRGQLEHDLDRANLIAEETDSFHRQIVEIETRIYDAKQKRDMEVLLDSRERALRVMREAREDDCRSAGGHFIGDFVRRQTRDLSRPPVFHRARELLVQITSGRYRLEFDSGNRPTLRATDTTTGISHGLDELSSGTRVQLLMAVRLAFVETAEHGPKLPLLLDETLGNSDELRAKEIIDAVLHICRDGRQVFYFTAQHDEVMKWTAVLRDAPGIPFDTVDLAEIRNFAAEERSPLIETTPVPRPVVPAVEGRTHAEYGLLLKVPNVDLWWSDTGGIHLWHLIDSPDVLHQLLSRGIGTWGQLQAIVSHGGDSAAGIESLTLRRAEARARACHVIASLWRIGRSRPVTRLVVLESGAISERFLDRVVELADQVGGDAQELITALQGGTIRGFRSSSAEQLRNYLFENGFLASESPLTLHELRMKALALLSNDVSGDLVRPDELDISISRMAPLGIPV